ncbi:ead/Ea22-like family protein [Klebsiella pneumoniae]|uniref:ead/Ea22-like family protein n=1 Tax=Klebsiella pneumoniae TaxID=573 RepID=UPI001E4BC361|nr:ead/Ea22-like family protein [Klebsiella pneumoniae]
MTDITELAQSLKAAAEKATQGNWRAFQYHDGRCGIGGGHNDEIMVCEHISKERPHDAMFIALANPANVLALVEALEKAQTKADVYDMLRDDYGLREKGVGLADFVDWQANRIAELESRTVSVKLTDINEYLADVHDKTLSLAFRRLAEAVRAGDVEEVRAAGIKVEAE